MVSWHISYLSFLFLELQTAQAKIFDLTNVLAQMHDIQAKSDQIYEVCETTKLIKLKNNILIY